MVFGVVKVTNGANRKVQKVAHNLLHSTPPCLKAMVKKQTQRGNLPGGWGGGEEAANATDCELKVLLADSWRGTKPQVNYQSQQKLRASSNPVDYLLVVTVRHVPHLVMVLGSNIQTLDFYSAFQ